MNNTMSWLIIATIILFGCVCAYFNRPPEPEPEPDKDVCGFASQVEYEHFKRLHRFHGTLSSFDIDGNCVYMRDGQICSLWDPLVRTDR